MQTQSTARGAGPAVLARGGALTEAESFACVSLFGNPFRPAEAAPAWLRWNGRVVVKLAEAIYVERRFADLPILADALEDAGCTDENLLKHCREPGEHVRGCWAVDLVRSAH